MRKILIPAQVAVITFLAVLGAQGNTPETASVCPAPSAIADRYCRE